MLKEKKTRETKKEKVGSCENTISITRALATIKRLSSELQDIDTISFAGVAHGDDVVFPFRSTLKEGQSTIEKSFRSFEGKYRQLIKLKEAIARANVETKVMHGGREYSLYELMALKQSIPTLITFYRRALFKLDEASDKRSALFNQELKDVLARRDDLSKANKSVNEIDRLAPQVNDSDFTVVKHLSREELVETIDMLQKEVGEIDMLLSEKNASTKISL